MGYFLAFFLGSICGCTIGIFFMSVLVAYKVRLQ